MTFNIVIYICLPMMLSYFDIVLMMIAVITERNLCFTSLKPTVDIKTQYFEVQYSIFR